MLSYHETVEKSQEIQSSSLVILYPDQEINQSSTDTLTMTLTCKTTFTTLPSPARVSSLENQITVRSHRNDHNHLIGPSFIITLGDILQLFTRTPSLLTPLISLLSLCLFLTLCASLPYSLGDYFSQGDGDNTKAEQSVTCDSALKLRERSCLQAGEP